MSEVMEAAIQAAIEDVHTVIPGRVVSYDGHSKRTASVQPVVRLPMVSGPLIDIAAIDGVPVMFPSTAAGSLLFPLSKGDGVLLLFSEVGIGRFLTSKAGTVSDPGAVGRHALHDAIAIPGLWSLPSVPGVASEVDNGSIALFSASGSVLELGSKLGLRNGSSDLRAEMESIWTAIKGISSHLQTSMQTLATASAAAPLTPLAAGFSQAVADATADAATADASKTNVGKLLK